MGKRRNCDFCGLEMRSRTLGSTAEPHYCCLGCAIAAEISQTSSRGLPVANQRQAVMLLVSGFLLFNQWFWWLFALLLQREEGSGSAMIASFSCLSGVLFLVVLSTWAASVPNHGWNDLTVSMFLLGFSILLLTWQRLDLSLFTATWLLLPSIGQVIWLGRTWLIGKLRNQGKS